MDDAIRHDDGRHDFDFLHGHWRLRNERLRQRLVGSDDWETFEADHHCRPILGGLGNVDEMASDWNGGFIGMSLRLFNPQARQWSIYWASNHSGILEAPVSGGFADGVGTFYGRERYQGRKVLQRFLWSRTDARTALWQQAWSLDDGTSWETNWRMHFIRLD